MKQLLILVFIIFFITAQSGYSLDKTGLWMGGEANLGYIIDYDIKGVSSVNKEVSGIHGASSLFEYRFTETLGMTLGFGMKFYTIKYKKGPNNYVRYKVDVEDISLAFRLRPLPYFYKNSDYSVFFGLGANVQIPTGSEASDNNVSGNTTTSTKQTGVIDTAFGLLVELGAGYYMRDDVLFQITFRYNPILNNIAKGNFSTVSKIRPEFMDLSVGIVFQM